MKKIITTITLLTLFTGAWATTLSSADETKVIWTAVFSDITPINPQVSQSYCDNHTPTVFVTTIEQITSKEGVTSLNGVNIRYLSYKTIEKDNLYFNIVDAVVSGKDNNGAWSIPMKLYEQTLSMAGPTYTVWSTPKCKGTFLGTPTISR